MGKVAGAQRFDGQNWYKQHIAKRTREALDEQDQAFAVRHAESTLNELACYLRRCAEHWGKSPAPCEIVGGDYIAERSAAGRTLYRRRIWMLCTRSQTTGLMAGISER